MKTRLLAFLVICVVAFELPAQAPRLSPSSQISLITCGPWQGELYSAFGHSAFRVYDPVSNIDWVFNYGTFDFNQPNFYLNFARGRNMYMLSVQDYPPFRDHYIGNNRYIHEQVLNLDAHRLQQLFQYLWNNALPQNREYRYDYFYDNCSTRPRDVLKAVLGDSLRFDYNWVKDGPTIRELTDRYLNLQPWGDLGIDICLGLPMDKPASGEEHLFLPDYLETAADHAFIIRNGQEMPLVRTKMNIYDAVPETTSASLSHPWLVFGGLLAMAVWLTYRDSPFGRWLDRLLWLVTGSVGLLLLLLWLVTDHRAAAWNMNLLWAMPLNLVIPFMSPRMRSVYMRTMAVWTALVLVFWAFLPQDLNVFLIPVAVALLMRYGYHGFRKDLEDRGLIKSQVAA